MKKHLIVLGIAVLLLAVGLSGCNEINPFSDDNKFVTLVFGIYNFPFLLLFYCAYEL